MRGAGVVLDPGRSTRDDGAVSGARAGSGVDDAELAQGVVDLLHAHPHGLRRADLRRELSAAWAARLAPQDLAVLDTRIGHALRRLKAAGDVVHHEKRQAYSLRLRGPDGGPDGGPRHLSAPATGDLSGLDAAEQESLF